MKNNTPGNYTFILKGDKRVPHRLLQEKSVKLSTALYRQTRLAAVIGYAGRTDALDVVDAAWQRFYRSRTLAED